MALKFNVQGVGLHGERLFANEIQVSAVCGATLVGHEFLHGNVTMGMAHGDSCSEYVQPAGRDLLQDPVRHGIKLPTLHALKP